MKRLLVSLIVSMMTAPALAAELNALNDKADQLELEQDVESSEQFGEAAGAVEARKESARLATETRQLEKDIASTKRANIRAEEKSKRLTELYNKKAMLAAKKKAEANRAEAMTKRSENKVSKIEARVKIKEELIEKSNERLKMAQDRQREIAKDNRDLSHRLARAEATIKRNEFRRKQIQVRNLKMARTRAQLKHRVARAESRAVRL